MAINIQNFSLPVGDDATVVLPGVLEDGFDLATPTFFWKAYAMQSGVPLVLSGNLAPVPLITKVSNGHGITFTDSPTLKINVTLESTDTISLLPGNYYHEVTVVDLSGLRATCCQGVMTLTQTENR